MENKEFKNALVNAMKVEIAQLANEQREQKKTRKLANRPKEKSLGDIVEEINDRAYNISILLYNLFNIFIMFILFEQRRCIEHQITYKII